MFENPIILLGLSTFFAAIPAAIWLVIFFSKAEKSRKIVALVFILGCLTAPALLGIQYLWEVFPNFNLASFIKENFQTQTTAFILTFVLFGAMEELIKLYVIRTVDKRTILINKVNDAIRYSLAAALGFSFVENIYYLYQFWPSISLGELTGMYIFRSVFTTCAHMIFSGIFGYYYGIGKFSMVITQQQQLTDDVSISTKLISKIFRLPLSEGYRQKVVVKGLIIALFMHSVFNYLLQFNIIIPVILFVILGYLYLQFLLKRKTGHLILILDPTEKKASTIAKKDADVVIELLGMWFKEKKFVDVIHICERLLERDPDNNVVKLFKAKALDEMNEKDTYKKILGTIIKSKDELSEDQKNLITKYTAEKDASIKNQANKPAQTISSQQPAPSNKPADPLEKYTGEGVFKL